MSVALQTDPAWEEVFAALGMPTVESMLGDARVIVWRTLPERENGVLETPRGRVHVKRYLQATGAANAQAELAGARLLAERGVPAIAFIAWGSLPDGRAVTVTPDLSGYLSAQQFLREGGRFIDVSSATAALAARLHEAGLHHRDLYLCHFFFRQGDGDCRLIDVARVKRLPAWLAKRWVVKDLAQFVFSTREFNVEAAAVDAWLEKYAGRRAVPAASFREAVLRKTDAIGRHDLRLRERQPTRNVSIPT